MKDRHMYWGTHKTMDYEDDCKTHVMIFNSPLNMKKKLCSAHRPMFHLISLFSAAIF